jgi:hypothetical protein
MAAAAQARRVEAALFALPLQTQHLLRVAHTTLLPALRVALADLGELAGVVVDSVPARELAAAIRDARQRSRAQSVAREAARVLIARWRADAGQRVGYAVAAYRTERRGFVLAERSAQRAREARRAEERGARLLGRVA